MWKMYRHRPKFAHGFGPCLPMLRRHRETPTLSGTLLENPTLCGTEISQKGIHAILAYAYCRMCTKPFHMVPTLLPGVPQYKFFSVVEYSFRNGLSLAE